MALRFENPFPQFWSSSAAYSGGTLNFYSAGTSTPLAVYSDKTLQSSIGTSVTLNSAGRYLASDIFLQNVDYRVILKDSDGNPIWTADPVRGTDYTNVPLWSVGSGSPSGVVAGTAASSGVMPSIYFDYANSIIYVCTTTGTASTAVWTAINASASTPSVPQPQGRLTLTSATPVLSSDVTAATAVYYTPYNGNLVPIYNGASMTPTEFTELTLTLASQHASGSLYDIFVFSNSGVLTLATGPAWTTATAGSSARGSGAGTTQLSMVKGFWVNTVSMTGRNGATTYTIGANLATYLGSIYIDATAGQVSCHTSFGQNRKWGLFNGYNRRPIVMRAGDSTASWSYNTATIRASNNVPSSYSATTPNVGSGTTCNSIVAFTGLQEENVEIEFSQLTKPSDGSGNSSTLIGIGINSTTAMTGKIGQAYAISTSITAATRLENLAKHVQVPFLGLTNIMALENVGNPGGATNQTFYGTNANTHMAARYMG